MINSPKMVLVAVTCSIVFLMASILTIYAAGSYTDPVEFHPQPTVIFNSSDLTSTPSTSNGYDWQLPAGFPVPRVPADNPMTAAKVSLGRYLFYDTHLSGNNTYSCSSCHQQALAFTDGRTVAIGSTGQLLPRNSPSLANVAYYSTLTWANPTLLTLEQQIPIPMFNEFPVEMGITGHEQVVLGYFQHNALYQQMFRAAFPDEQEPVSFDSINKALASFLRTLISGNSPYDQYVFQGNQSALSPSAVRGMNLFLSEKLECNHCHTGFNFTLSLNYRNLAFVGKPFFNTGLYNIGGEGNFPVGNRGLYEITSQPADMGRFRPPTLRNIALTAPYMHDGSIATLREVIQFYSQGGRVIERGPYTGDGRANPYKSTFVNGFTLTDQDMDDLVSFLNSLTDEQFIADKRFSDPFAAGSADPQP